MISGRMGMPQIKAIMRNWADDSPPPVRTQLLVLRSLARLKAEARARPRRSIADVLSRAMRAFRPSSPRLEVSQLVGRSRYERRSDGFSFREIAEQDGVSKAAVIGSISAYAKRIRRPMPKPRLRAERLSVSQLASILGRNARTVAEWADKGLLPHTGTSPKRWFVLEEVRAAMAKLPAFGGRVFDPGGARGQLAAARAAERGTGMHTCSKCRQLLSLSSYPPSAARRGSWMCRACRKPYTRASDMKRRRKMTSTRSEPVAIAIVAARDGWMCGICRGKVTKATWSLDHIVPISKGGPHTYDNVVLAHKLCNSRRQDGRLPVQAPLFARL